MTKLPSNGGVGVAIGVPVGVADGDGEGEPDGEGEGDGVTPGVPVADGVGVTPGVPVPLGVGVTLGLGEGAAPHTMAITVPVSALPPPELWVHCGESVLSTCT